MAKNSAYGRELSSTFIPDGWLEEFFRKISEHSDWITLLPPGEVLKRGVGQRGRMYFPTSSYAEMMQWSLPKVEASRSYENFLHALEEVRKTPSFPWADALDHSFVQGGYWRNFFVKYPEGNHLHKHTLRTSARIKTLTEAGIDTTDAHRELRRAQCNDPYWHGVFGGIYLSNLRHANYTALVKADALLDEAESLTGIRMEASDMDCDGAEEVILESQYLFYFCQTIAWRHDRGDRFQAASISCHEHSLAASGSVSLQDHTGLAGNRKLRELLPFMT